MCLATWLSLIAIGWGVFALRLNTKHLPMSIKYSPVFLTALGTIISWQHLLGYLAGH